jgi:hypothetical protein
MEKLRVFMLCEKHLLGESLEHILLQSSDVDLQGCEGLDERVLPQLVANPPDLLVIADEGLSGDQASWLTTRILELLPSLPVLRVTLERNELRIYTSQSLPARSADLIDLFHRLRS